MRAEGYMMNADLTGGILTLEGTNKASRLALDAQLTERLEAAIGQHGDDRDAEAFKAAYKDAAKRQVPRIPVSAIERVEFKDASMMTNGRLDVYVAGSRFQFHFRRKTADQVRALYDELNASLNA